MKAANLFNYNGQISRCGMLHSHFSKLNKLGKINQVLNFNSAGLISKVLYQAAGFYCAHAQPEINTTAR